MSVSKGFTTAYSVSRHRNCEKILLEVCSNPISYFSIMKFLKMLIQTTRMLFGFFYPPAHQVTWIRHPFFKMSFSTPGPKNPFYKAAANHFVKQAFSSLFKIKQRELQAKQTTLVSSVLKSK